MINTWLDDKWSLVSRIGTWFVVMSEVPRKPAPALLIHRAGN